MTAIIGFTNADRNVGFLAADNMEYGTKARADKLIKVQKRYVLGFAGNEDAKFAVELCVQHFDQFDYPANRFNSVEDLQYHLQEVFNYSFPKWKKSNFMYNKKQSYQNSQIVFLDCSNNNLFKWEIGNVWDESNQFDSPLVPHDNEVFLIAGSVPPEDIDKKNNFSDHDEIYKYLMKAFDKINRLHPKHFGKLGTFQINIVGAKPYSTFNSAYQKFEDITESLCARDKPPVLSKGNFVSNLYHRLISLIK